MFRLCVRIAAYVCVCVNTHSVLEVCLCRRVRIQMQQNNNKKQCVSKLSKRTLPNSLLFFARACQRKRKEKKKKKKQERLAPDSHGQWMLKLLVQRHKMCNVYGALGLFCMHGFWQMEYDDHDTIAWQAELMMYFNLRLCKSLTD